MKYNVGTEEEHGGPAKNTHTIFVYVATILSLQHTLTFVIKHIIQREWQNLILLECPL